MNKFRGLFSASAAVTTLAGQTGVDLPQTTVGEVIAQGLKRCRAIKLSQLSLEDFGQSAHQGIKRFRSLGSNVEQTSQVQSEAQFLGKSFPCDKPDFFVSHSMHDDADAKWEALREISQRFQAEFSIEPTFWIDKYCVDQSNVAEQLMYLPVFIMCSERVLVLSGPTYFRRLWCCWELFVYSLIYPKMEKLMFWSLSNPRSPSSSTPIDHFQVRDVECFMESDKVAIMAAIEAFEGGTDGFDERIQAFGKKLAGSNGSKSV